MEETGKNISELDDRVHYPQIMVNLITENKKEIMSDPKVNDFMEKIKEELGVKGRVLLRASGTEPKIRIMAECFDRTLAEQTVDRIKTFIESNYRL